MKLRVALPAVDIVSYFMTVQQGGIFYSLTQYESIPEREVDGWVVYVS